MSKYDRLFHHLMTKQGDKWAASFAEIEAVLGFPLPDSASRYPAWWANQTGGGHSQSGSWQQAGWQTSNLDLARKQVEFKKVEGQHATTAKPVDQQDPTGDDLLMAQAARMTGITDRPSLVRAGLTALVEREAAQRLARLGGSMPDYEMPPRRRVDVA